MNNKYEAGSFIAYPVEGGPRGCNPFSRFFPRPYVVNQVRLDGSQSEVGIYHARTIGGAIRKAVRQQDQSN